MRLAAEDTTRGVQSRHIPASDARTPDDPKYADAALVDAALVDAAPPMPQLSVSFTSSASGWRGLRRSSWSRPRPGCRAMRAPERLWLAGISRADIAVLSGLGRRFWSSSSDSCRPG